MESLLRTSSATPAFKASVASFIAGKAADRVKVESFVPRVKVRLLTQLLNAEPSLEIEHVTIRGKSG